MKRGLWILLAGLALAGLSCLFCYRLGLGPHHGATDPVPELTWLRREFSLSETEYQRILDLHQAYLPKCRENCRKLAVAEDHLKALLHQNRQFTPDVEQAIQEIARLKGLCQTEMLRHFYGVSQAMPQEQGKRYLEWVTEQTVSSSTVAPLMSHGH